MPAERKNATLLLKAPSPTLRLPLPLVSVLKYNPPILVRSVSSVVPGKIDEDVDDETSFNSFGCVSFDPSTSAIALPHHAALPIEGE